MALIAKGGKHFTPAPEGLWPAVCVDVVDLGMVTTTWGEKHKCRIVWELSEKMADGRRFIASKQYTLSLHEKAALHKDLKSWRGRPFTPEELEAFDVELVIGAPCQLLITQEEKDGMVYGNVTTIMRADPKNRLTPSGSYVRKVNRKDIQSSTEESGDDGFDGATNDDIPF